MYVPRHADIYTVPAVSVKTRPSVDDMVVRPVTVRVGFTDKMIPSHHTGTSGSIQQLGGIRVFLFLFAKVCNNLC